MQTIEELRNIISYELPLSKVDRKTLNVLTSMKVGNAYSVWKESRLKHYPTVLRSLKKLKEKGCAKVTAKGMRGDNQYSPTLLGTLVPLILEGKQRELREIIAENSSKFKDLVRANAMDINDLMFQIVQVMLWHQRRGRKASIDQILEDEIDDRLAEDILLILEGSKDALVKITKVPWVREIAVMKIERQLDWNRKQTDELKRIKESLIEKQHQT